MVGLKNIYVQNLAHHCLEQFSGVFACDMIPTVKLRRGDSLIVNLSKSNTPGTHFVAIHRLKDSGKYLYFDSYGLKCWNGDVLNYFKGQDQRDVIYSNRQIQSWIGSYFCGYFCIAALIYLELGKSMLQFHELFDTVDLSSNDEICTKIIKSHIKSLK